MEGIYMASLIAEIITEALYSKISEGGHTGLIGSNSIQITALTACIILKTQQIVAIKSDIVIFMLVKSVNLNEKNPPGGSVIQKYQKQILKS